MYRSSVLSMCHSFIHFLSADPPVVCGLGIEVIFHSFVKSISGELDLFTVFRTIFMLSQHHYMKYH